MPNCDGVSATIYIRQLNQSIPIIAMTSNIRQDEIASYYQWGELPSALAVSCCLLLSLIAL